MTSRRPPPELRLPQGSCSLRPTPLSPPLPTFGTAKAPEASSLSMNFHLTYQKKKIKNFYLALRLGGVCDERALNSVGKKNRKTMLEKKKNLSIKKSVVRYVMLGLGWRGPDLQNFSIFAFR